MKKTLVALVVILSLVGCRQREMDANGELKKQIEQSVRAVYSPKSLVEFKESYNKVIADGLMTKEAADSFYIVHGDVLTDSDLKRSCYVDVLYSNSDENSEGREHYLAKLQLQGSVGDVTTADIIFYLSDGEIIDEIIITNIETGD